MFQSLIGKLQTVLCWVLVLGLVLVSIPHREATNPKKGYKSRVFKTVFTCQGAHSGNSKTERKQGVKRLSRNFYFSVDPPGFWGYHTSTEKELHFKGVMRLKPRSEAGKRENSFKAAPQEEERLFSLKFSVDLQKAFIYEGFKVFSHIF